MNKTIIASFTIICIICTVSCSNHETGEGMTIDVTTDLNNVLPSSELGYNIDYKIIKLDSDVEAFVKAESGMRFEAYLDYLYIASMGTVKIFHKNGDYITSLPIGNGPGEIPIVSGMSVNRLNKTLEVTTPKFLIIYDLVGLYIETRELPAIKKTEFAAFGDKHIFLQSNTFATNTNFVILDNDDSQYEFEAKTCITKDKIHFPRHFNYSQDDKTIYFTGYSDKVYLLKEGEERPQVIATVTNMAKESLPEMTSDDYWDYCKKHNYFWMIKNFYQYNDELYGFELDRERLLYNSATDKYYFHPMNKVMLTFGARCEDNNEDFFIFPQDLLNDQILDKIKEKNLQFYNLITTELTDNEENTWVIKLTYTKK